LSDGLDLEIRGVTKRYGALTAANQVSFTIRQGEILGLIGPNGSGKTTVLECLGGALPADAGGIVRGGRVLSAGERLDALFYLPDGIAPWPRLTVEQSLAFVVAYFGGRRELQDAIVAELQLRPLLRQRVGELSKGQRKRALLAAGLLTSQTVLIADEPFDGLDLPQTREVAGVLRAHKSRRTMLLSIHQIGDAARVCDRFVLLSGGQVLGEGTPSELAAMARARGREPATPELEEVFLALV